MARKERVSKGRVMRPNYFVFCEGDTEVVYVEMLRSYYRLPIHIIAKKTLLNVTPELVERCKSVYVRTERDRTFLMYDLDVVEMLERLKKVPEMDLLCSNPCFELWLLLHFKDVKAPMTGKTCISSLSTVMSGYKKGTLSQDERISLMNCWKEAAERAKRMHPYENPSTTVYLLIEELERLKVM